MKFQQVFEALADPNRRRILEVLKKGEKTVGEIAAYFEITGASLSHHLNKLKAADLVLTRRQGQNIYYSLHTTVFEDVASFAADFFSLRSKK
jgi:DNA-binding transcriptional ArsR family regulator